MSSLDLESLLLPISAVEPSGPDLEYDAQVAELDQAVKGKPEQQFGDTIIEGEEPDWKAALRIAGGLLIRTKDLRVAVQLAKASLGVDGLDAFRDVTHLILNYITEYWESVHPMLDETDDDDPTERINAIASLRDPSSTLRLLKAAPLLSVPGLGSIRLLDIEIARGEVSPSEDADPPISMTTIDGAFQSCDLDRLETQLSVVKQTEENLTSIETAITEKVGVAQAVSLEPVVEIIHEIRSLLESYSKKRQADAGASPQADEVSDQGPDTGSGVATQSFDNGVIRKRDDVIHAIERICDYYETYEPSSPLPLLLNRAKRLVTASFMEIIQDLTPDALEQAERIGGRTDD